MTGPLDGIRVVETATLFAGPLAATHLGDFGADVVKVEHPRKPDAARTHGPAKDGVGLWWKTIGEFSDNIGFRLELWRPEYLRQAEALVADYTAQARETKLELYPAFMPLPTKGRQNTA